MTDFDLSLGLGALGLALLALALALSMASLWRQRCQHRDELARLDAVERRLCDTIAEVELRQTARLAALGTSVGILRSDVELIAGDWSVRQAVELAMEGVDPATIESETGLDPDEVRTLLRVRPH